jgi:hypothetical protein
MEKRAFSNFWKKKPKKQGGDPRLHKSQLMLEDAENTLEDDDIDDFAFADAFY